MIGILLLDILYLLLTSCFGEYEHGVSEFGPRGLSSSQTIEKKIKELDKLSKKNKKLNLKNPESLSDNPSSFRNHFNNPSYTSNESISRFSNNLRGIRNYNKGFFVDVKSEFINKFNLRMFKKYEKKPSNQELIKTSAPTSENPVQINSNIDTEAYVANKKDI